MLESIARRINHFMAGFGGVSLGFIMVFLLVDIVSRTISKPIAGAGEMAVFAMIVAVYSGVPYCEETQNHVNVEAFTVALPEKWKLRLGILTQLLSLLTLGILVYAVGEYALSTFQTNEAIPGPRPMPIYPVTFVIFASMAAYFLQAFVNLMQSFYRK